MLLLFGCQVMSNSFVTPRTVAPRLISPWDFPGKNTGVGFHFLLQGIFLTQGSNPSLFLDRGIFLPLHHQESPYDPEILLLGIYPEKTITQKDTCTLMFIAALFIIARTWKQFRCPSTDEWIKMWYIYTMEYYSAIKRNELNQLKWCGWNYSLSYEWNKSENKWLFEESLSFQAVSISYTLLISILVP